MTGTDSLNLMRRRIERDRKAAQREIAQLKPLTESRWNGEERTQPDDDARNAIARLTAFLDRLDDAEEALT